jgi:hypothetical protein
MSDYMAMYRERGGGRGKGRGEGKEFEMRNKQQIALTSNFDRSRKQRFGAKYQRSEVEREVTRSQKTTGDANDEPRRVERTQLGKRVRQRRRRRTRRINYEGNPFFNSMNNCRTRFDRRRTEKGAAELFASKL